MKLIAEIEATNGGGMLRLSCEGEMLTVGDVCVALSEFREALDAVAPRLKPNRLEQMFGPSSAMVVASQHEPTRDATGARIGVSPRFGMRARPGPTPEANAEELDTIDEQPAA